MVEHSTRRACGGCTLCCLTHGVQLSKKVFKVRNEWCTHCTIGGGCQIHETSQPGACHDWNCAWLGGLGPESARPDKTQVVVEWSWTPFGRTLVMTAATPDALSSDYATSATARYAEQGIPIQYRQFDGKTQVVFKQGTSVEPSLRHQCEKEGVEIVFVETE